MAYHDRYGDMYDGAAARGRGTSPPHPHQYTSHTSRDDYEQHFYAYPNHADHNYGHQINSYDQVRAFRPQNEYQAFGPPGRPPPSGARGVRAPGSESRAGAPPGRYPPNTAYAAGRPPFVGGAQPGRHDAAYDADHDLDGHMANMNLGSQFAGDFQEPKSSSERHHVQGDHKRPAFNGSRGPQRRDYASNGYGDSRNGPPFRKAPNDYAGYGEDYTPGPNGGFSAGFGPPARSLTLPVHESQTRHNALPQRTDTMPVYSPAGRGGIPQRSSTATGSQPPPRRMYPPSAQRQLQLGFGSDSGPGNQAGAGRRHGHEPAVSSDEVFDTYFDDSQPRRSSFSHVNAGSAVLERGGSFEQQHRPGAHQTPRLLHAKSEANLREPQAAIFEMAADAPAVPLIPSMKPYQLEPANGYGQPGGYDLTGDQAALSNGYRSHPGSDGLSRAGSATSRSINPDALPSHPTPVRPGLMANSMVSLNERPLPVRNYGGASQAGPLAPQLPLLEQQRPIMRAGHKPTPRPVQREDKVTPQELERLRMVIKHNANDQDSALSLAKKLTEAADVLAHMMPDATQRARTRERYLLDAQKILKKLANAQNQEAMFAMADGLGRGLFGHEAGNKEAFTLYQSAAKLGHAAAAYRTAVCCEIGHEEGGGTRKDPLKAMQWYKRAATLGDPPAMYKVGMILLKGFLGQQRNPKEAVEWLKRAAERADAENPHALHELGLLYESAQPNDTILRDERYALSLFQQASELGYKFSQYRLGCVFEYGLMGCPIDPRQSIYWYSKAAAQEEHQSELALSGWYLTGSEGLLSQSDTEAYLWAKKAATAGLAKAEYAMGYFTEVGIGISANLEDAKRWYWRAAAQEFPKARERLEDLKRAGKHGRPRQRERITRSGMERQQEGECRIM